MKFGMLLKRNQYVLDILSEKLIAALKDETLSIDYKNIITEILQILKSYKIYAASILMKYEVFHKKINSSSISIPVGKNLNKKWSNNDKQDISSVINKDEGNWRTLKPDSNPHSDVFLRRYQKRTNSNT